MGASASHEGTARQEQVEHAAGPDSARATEASPLAAALRNRVVAARGLPERLAVRRERVQTAATVSAFYERWSYEPAWVTLSGLTPDVRELLDALATSDADGLRPDDYHVSVLDSQVRRIEADSLSDPDVGRLVEVELLLTDGFLLYGSHLLMGRVGGDGGDGKPCRARSPFTCSTGRPSSEAGRFTFARTSMIGTDAWPMPWPRALPARSPRVG